MAKSNYAAFQRLTPLKGEVSDDIKYWNNDAGQRRREDQNQQNLEDQKALAEKERKRKIYDENIKPLNNYDTGSKSLNEKQAFVLMEAEKQMLPLVETIANSEPGSPEVIQAKLKLEKLKKIPEQMQGFTSALTKENETYLKGVQSGTIWGDNSWEKNFQEGYGNMEAGIDSDGNLTVAFKDENGDGINDVMTYDNVQGVLSSRPEIMTKFDLKGSAKTIADNLGFETVQTDAGFVKRKKKNVDPNKLEQQAMTFLYDGQEISPAAKSFLRENGMDWKNPKADDIAKVKELFKQEVMSNISTEDITDKAYSEQTSAARLAMDKRDKETQKVVTQVNSQDLIDNFTNSKVSPNSIYPNMISFSDNSVKVKNLGGQNSGLNSGYVTGMALDKKGDIVVMGKALKSKNAKFKVGDKTIGLEALMNEANNGNKQAQAQLDSYTAGDNYGSFVRKVSGSEKATVLAEAGFSSEEEAVSALKKENNIQGSAKKEQAKTSNKSSVL